LYVSSIVKLINKKKAQKSLPVNFGRLCGSFTLSFYDFDLHVKCPALNIKPQLKKKVLNCEDIFAFGCFMIFPPKYIVTILYRTFA